MCRRMKAFNAIELPCWETDKRITNIIMTHAKCTCHQRIVRHRKKAIDNAPLWKCACTFGDLISLYSHLFQINARLYISNVRLFKKVTLSLYRPREAPRVPAGWGFTDFQTTQESGKVVSPTHRRPLLLRGDPADSFLLKAELTQDHSAAGRTVNKTSQRPHQESNPPTSAF